MDNIFKGFAEKQNSILLELDQYLLSDFADCITTNFSMDNFENYLPECKKVLYNNIQNVNFLDLYKEILFLNTELEKGNLVQKVAIQTIIVKLFHNFDVLKLRHKLDVNLYEMIKFFNLAKI